MLCYAFRNRVFLASEYFYIFFSWQFTRVRFLYSKYTLRLIEGKKNRISMFFDFLAWNSKKYLPLKNFSPKYNKKNFFSKYCKEKVRKIKSRE